MRSFILQILGFMAFGVLAYPFAIGCAASLLPEPWLRNVRFPLAGNGHLLTRLREAERFGHADVVFLGSSHAYRGFDPRIWQADGLRAFNLGSSSQCPLQSEVLARTCIPELTPRIVLFEVHPAPFRMDGLESGMDLVTNRSIDLAALRMAARIPDVRMWNTLIRSGWHQLFNNLEEVHEPARNNKDEYVPGGYVQRIDMKRKAMIEQAVGKHELAKKQIRAFQRTCAQLREAGIRVILVEAPVTKSLYERWNEIRPDFERLMRAEAPYVNMNGLAGLNDSAHFFSPGHLNHEGVILMNAALLDSLHSKGLIE